MKILFCGDVVGKSGRKALKTYLSFIQDKIPLDAIIVNAENSAHGFGLTHKVHKELKNQPIDIITLGNHTFDKSDVHQLLQEDPFLVRPLNYPENTLGNGFCTKILKNGKRLTVVQLLGKLYMRPVLDPFETIQIFLEKHGLLKDTDILIIDYHAEATAEKIAFGHFLDGKATAVLGTHTHIPTADALILPHGTAYMTDVGMCGDYNSVIGMQVQCSLNRFLGKTGTLEPATKQGTFCGVLIDIDEETGLAKKINPIRLGPCLENTLLENLSSSYCI